MAQDSVLAFPCETSQVERLDEMLQNVYSGINSTDDLKRFVYTVTDWDAEKEDALKDYIYAEVARKIRWEKIRHLRIIGDDDPAYPENFETEGIPRGYHLNLDCGWLLVVLPERPHLGDLFSRCGMYLDSLWILNSQMYSRNWKKLHGLKQLYLADNPMLDTIEGIGCLSDLEQFTIVNCARLTQILDLGNLKRLKQLRIEDCDKLKTLSGLENLTQLTKLDLSRCDGFTALPALDQLTNLTTLDLDECTNLAALPGLGKLTQLTKLDLSWCDSLTALPGLENLTQLTKLNLFGCSELPSIPGIEHLTRLQDLDLSYCTSLQRIPEGIRYLDNLRFLGLGYLHLEDLPDWLPEIAESFTATMLDGIGKRKASVWLYKTMVDEIPDMSIFDQPYEMVAEWFRNRSRGKTQPLNEIKVVFLGDGEAGKSHTIARLMNDGGPPVDYTDKSTPGIVIKHKDYTVDGRKFRVHYWDFGGQEIMHSMHRIFLTGRTMYVILLNARDDTQSDRAKYWLHNVKSFAPDAPVLMVLNKIDQNENASVDEADLRGRYEKLTQVVKLSALEFSREEFNAGFTRVLLEEILKTGFLDAQWPASWTQVKEKLENMENYFILGDDYQAICRECHVNDNQKDLLHWFNDLGVSFCCCDDADYTLEDYVILRPDWITNALYIILFNKLRDMKNGLIPHRIIYDLLENAHNNPEVRCTLPKTQYTESDIQYVLGIMHRFSLSFDDTFGNEFIPMLCQQNSLLDVQYYQKDTDILEFNMEFDYLPNNLLHRLMVERRGELDLEIVWRTGARFRHEALKLSAVVAIDGNILRFFIRHENPMHRPNTYLTMLKASVDRIVEKMGLKAPSCQLVYKLDGRRDSFDLDMLKAMQEARQTQVFSMTWRRMINIDSILSQSAPDSPEDDRKFPDAIRRSSGNTPAGPDDCMEDKRNRRIRDGLLG